MLAIRSGDTLATMGTLGLRAGLADATIKSARIKLVFPGNKRGKTIQLKVPNKLSFNRATQADRVMDYLNRWNLIRE